LKSLERGFILYSLINYKINDSTFREIIRKSTFNHADLAGVILEDVNLDSASLNGIHLSNSIIVNSSFTRSSMYNSNLNSCFIIKSNFNNSRLEGANLSFSKISGTDLRNVNLEGADLRNTDFLSIPIGDSHHQVRFSDDYPIMDSWLLRRAYLKGRAMDEQRSARSVSVKKWRAQKVDLNLIDRRNWVDSNWVQNLKNLSKIPKGASSIKRNYSIDTIKYLDSVGETFYLLEAK
jgi:uncharacterized protein YjbI with pentapeptide repeats